MTIQPSRAGAVEATLPANAASSPGVLISSVSCASAGNCSAVGDYLDSSGAHQGLLLSESGGTWATGVEAALPANAASNPDVLISSVSCASAGNCSAVGDYLDSSGAHQGLLLSESGGTWATGVEAALPADAGSDTFVFLPSVSCASAGNCTAVGTYTDSSGHPGNAQGLLLSESGGTWAPGLEAALPAHSNTTEASANIDSVSCASAGNCTAVGYYDGSSGRQGLLLSEIGGSWAPEVDAVLPANTSSPSFVIHLTVSCASAGNCSAVGTYLSGDYYGSHSYQGLLLSESGGSWAPGVEATPPANAASSPDPSIGEAFSVSCASAGNCSAVGDYLDSSGAHQGLLLSESGGSWAPGVEAVLPANAAADPEALPFSVSCASAGNCSAVGDYFDNTGNNPGNEQGLLLSEVGGTWGPGVEAVLPANAAADPEAFPFSVSCPSASDCSAVGNYTDSSGHQQGLLLRGGGGSDQPLSGSTLTQPPVTPINNPVVVDWSFTDHDPGAVPNDFTAWIDWNDGNQTGSPTGPFLTPSTSCIGLQCSFVIGQSHIYGQPGTYHPVLHITDTTGRNDNGGATLAIPSTVSVIQPIQLLSPADKQYACQLADTADRQSESTGELGIVLGFVPVYGALLGGEASSGSLQLGHMAFELEKLCGDPPDPNFQAIASPVLAPSFTVPRRVPARLRRALQQWLDNSREEAALLRALRVSIEREQGAAAANNGDWAARQMNAAAGYASRSAADMQQEVTLLKGLPAVLKRLPRWNPKISARVVRRAQRYVRRRGLPAAFKRALQGAGATDADLAALQTAILNTPPSSLTGKLFGHLTSAAYLAQLTSTAKALNDFAASASHQP